MPVKASDYKLPVYTNIILKTAINGYEEVTIITENGKIINCTKTKKTKLYKKNIRGRV